MGTNAYKNITVVLPCYNDAGSLEVLLPKIEDELAKLSLMHDIVVVNDRGISDRSLNEVSASFSAQIVHAPYNMGSQEAIVYGIRWVCAHQPCDFILTMDADGQDDPSAIPALLDVARTGKIAVAQRTGARPEGWCFRLAHRIDKLLLHFMARISLEIGILAANLRVVSLEVLIADIRVIGRYDNWQAALCQRDSTAKRDTWMRSHG